MSVVSFLRLGWYFVQRWLARLFVPQRGLLRFRQHYEADRLYALEEEERRAVAALSRCIGCGLCDAYFGEYSRVGRVALRGPSDFVLGHTRSLPDWDALSEAVGQLERGQLEEMKRVCPVQVPFEQVAKAARRRAAQLRAPRAAPALRPTAGRRHDPG